MFIDLYFLTEILGRFFAQPGAPVEADPVGTCWGSGGLSSRSLCTNPISQGATFMDCCCGGAVGWGADCDPCPPRRSGKILGNTPRNKLKLITMIMSFLIHNDIMSYEGR